MGFIGELGKALQIRRMLMCRTRTAITLAIMRVTTTKKVHLIPDLIMKSKLAISDSLSWWCVSKTGKKSC